MNPAHRRPWLAALLGLLCNGLGHLYAGSAGGAAAVFAAWLIVGATMSLALRAGPIAFGATAAAALAFWIGQALHAAALARRRAATPRTRASHPLALVAFYVATVVVSNVVLPPFRTRVSHTLYAPSGSMIPTIHVGDVVAVAAGRPRVLRGVVVEFEARSGSPSRDPQVKRVVAVAGDAVEIKEGALWVNDAPVAREAGGKACGYADRQGDGAWREEPCVDFVETLDGRAYHTYCTPYLPCGDVDRQVVPEGTVWVAGDHRDHSADSRVYGPIPERAILGEVRWVMGSWGPSGPRWGRFGLEIR